MQQPSWGRKHDDEVVMQTAAKQWQTLRESKNIRVVTEENFLDLLLDQVSFPQQYCQQLTFCYRWTRWLQANARVPPAWWRRTLYFRTGAVDR
jgi:hypothetical protein